MVKVVSKKIGRFNLIRELGKGSQGVVHLAVDPVLQRNVAIKTLHVANLSNVVDTKKLLLKEARTIGKIEHPNIVSIYEAGEDQNQNPYLVFEYVNGQLLSDIMKKKGIMSVNNALELLKPAIEAISHADQQNIIHCDLKPANILINDENINDVIVVSNAYHLQRIIEISKFFNIKIKVAAPNSYLNYKKKLYMQLRESIALIVFWSFAL